MVSVLEVPMNPNLIDAFEQLYTIEHDLESSCKTSDYYRQLLDRRAVLFCFIGTIIYQHHLESFPLF